MFDSKNFLKNVSQTPGVYRMLDESGGVLYVGKAGNLRKRLSSYFRRDTDSPKTRSMVAQIADVEVILTNTEAEALLLENNLIKEYRPRYNVLLRDDKSYPYIHITDNQEFPRLEFYRGSRKLPGSFIGPYPNAGAVRKSMRHVQKLFRVRQCVDSYFNNRSRPCLQYQIKRCSAPCVGLIEEQNYRLDVERTHMLLKGKDSDVVEQLVGEMESASQALDFERAAKLRDQIADIKSIGEKQYVSNAQGNIDVIACSVEGGRSCVQVFLIRNGMNLGNRAFFPSMPAEAEPADVLNAFLTQYYLRQEIPKEILVSHPIDDHELLESVLAQRSDRKIKITANVRGERSRWLDLAQNNADSAMAVHLSSRAGSARRLENLREILDLPTIPARMECFDISHTRGEGTVASCVVFNIEGPLKQAYRRFSIRDVTPGDDYAAMKQALTRRYTRALKENAELPDVLFVDGGKGQVSVAREVLEDLQLDEILLVGVAKGPARIAGEEILILDASETELELGKTSPALHLVQQIRDEAHRFAIAGHRAQRGKKRSRSVLEDIPGLGPKRRKTLLSHFGGMQSVQKAGIDDLAMVPGISRELARKIYENFHGENSS
ncbi:MAG: excinuclease ABC subunit UvrC [Pseudomonadota bacterium]